MKKVLVVDDTRDIREALKRLIELHGYAAVTAGGGFDALKKAREEMPDLILMDLAMPDISGEDVVREIRSWPDFDDIPILCVSSYTEGHEGELMAVGHTEIFSKSSFIESMVPILKKYLDQEPPRDVRPNPLDTIDSAG